MLILAAGANPAAATEAAGAGADVGPVGVRVTTTLVTERIALPRLRGPIELISDPLGAKFELRANKDAAALARLAVHADGICPKVIATDNGIEMRCRTRRFEAMITVDHGKKYLDINELRGLPWREGPGGPPNFHYEPFRSGIGAGCPGLTPAARGECAFKAGRLFEAASQFRDAMETSQTQVAALRLGDIALSTGDPATAIGWYRRAGTMGVFGRMARTRVCEIEGTCLASTEIVKRVFDPAGLPEPLRAEVQVRAVRVEAFAGRIESAMQMLWAQVRTGGIASICREGGEPICRRVVLEMMRQSLAVAAPPLPKMLARAAGAAGADSEPPMEEKAMEIYLALPRWDRGFLAAELSEAAADLSGRLGAPIFGGNILSAAAPEVSPEMLPEHLLRAAELFLEGDDMARTRLVIEYARTRIGKRTSPRWAAVEKKVAARAAAEDQSNPSSGPSSAAEKPAVDTAGISREIAAATSASGRARKVAGEPAAPKQGEKQ